MTTGPGAATADAVRRWLDSLDDAARDAATFEFEDPDRFAWGYVPGTRAGLALGAMRADQRAAALAVVDATLSRRGTNDVKSIIDLEAVLGALEDRPAYRDSGRYWLAVFGEPDPAGPWGWRLEGHHVSIHVTLADGAITAVTPSFLGANPARVPSGPSAGLRPLAPEEDLGRELVTALSAGQRSIGVVDPVAPPDILSGTGRRADLRDVPSGIRADQLDAGQRSVLERLVRHYLGRAEPSIAASAWEQIEGAGIDELTFAWAGPSEPGRGHYYAVRGPTVLIEYDNTQNGANHVHSVWRDPDTDWGVDPLTAHYRRTAKR